jgi:hypothetical protein
MAAALRARQTGAMKKRVCAIFVLSAAAASAAPHEGGRPYVAERWNHDRVIAAGFADDGNEDMIYDNRPMVLLEGHSRGKANGDWLKFGTDACGRLQTVDSRHSMLRESSFGDDMDQYDEDDPANEARQMVGQWLSQHAEIAVINDGVDRSCDESGIVDGEGDTLEIA